jgi:hypothetical protein
MTVKCDHTLLDITIERTLDAWVCRYSHEKWRGARIEGWLFEGVAARRSAEQRLAALGVTATFRSAYKPLLHYFLEEIDADRLSAVTVHYPVHPQAPASRFLLEAYPLDALLPDCDLRFLPLPMDAKESPFYRVDLVHRDGQRSSASVLAPNRMHVDHIDATQLSPTGWLSGHLDHVTFNHAQETDYEALFTKALATVQHHPWPNQEPYFDRLNIRVDLASIEQALPLANEHISSAEALHEDLYFSLLEVFQRHSGRSSDDRRLQPGQIVPDVRIKEGPPRLHIAIQRFEPLSLRDVPAPQLEPYPSLATLDRLASAERIDAELEKLGGERFQAHSRQGRMVQGRYHRADGPAVLISAGQHANEASGVVAALRAAHMLQASGTCHFALIALENPDGYALYHELLAQNPLHMHHAARYSALGDDIEHRINGPLFEREAREQALVISGANLHINLHGYPAHEWTRPLTGYVPRGFDLWTIPKGFFLILRYHTGWDKQGRALLEAICAALILVPGLAAYNARQMQRYKAYAGPAAFEFIYGIPCMIDACNRPGAPLTFITEIPDETLTGAAFVFAHTVQMQAVLAAVEAWRTLAAGQASTMGPNLA